MPDGFERIISKLPENVARAAVFLPENIKENVCEIRLRRDLPVALTMPDKTFFLTRSGGVVQSFCGDLITVGKKDINDCFLRLCNRSVYAHYSEISEGFISLGGGCRAGVCGRFSHGRPAEVFSLNLRIARQVKNCAAKLLPFADKGLLIAGPPGSGKTTVLRDAVRLLSNNRVRVSVIDSRQEISPGFDLGAFCDVLVTRDKVQGAQIALRTMSPQVIAFDEIATAAELKSVSDIFSAGVFVLTTAHVSSAFDLAARTVTRKLFESGAVKFAALLDKTPGGAIKMLDGREVPACTL